MYGNIDFKPKIYSKEETAIKFYERKLKKEQDKQA
jgi:hypothetical protein